MPPPINSLTIDLKGICSFGAEIKLESRCCNLQTSAYCSCHGLTSARRGSTKGLRTPIS